MGFQLTYVLLAITIGISLLAFQNYELKSKLLFNPYSVKHKGEWYRFVSHGFIHGDQNHLFINMFVLWQFGGFIESKFAEIFGAASGGIYILFYIAAIIVSCISTYFKSNNNPGYNSLGASGATSAIVFAFIIFDPWSWFIFPPLPAIILAFAYLFYSSYMDKRKSDNIGHNAHFWGAIFGFVFVMAGILIFNPPPSSPYTEATTMLGEILEKLLAGPSKPGIFGG